ncbi:MAG: 16S rRNA processing protein RimM [Alphaproteobacteria bacterium]|nr:16S rRNA processing protein RimM [Alphaproteobacteria bacterium]OJV15280.1 MAG: 16S rRNA processing protein RimM [Alphaproteobacteria bacterium 33-17]
MSKLVLVGYIIGSHGVKGEVKVKALTPNFFGFPALYKENNEKIKFKVRSSNQDVSICSIDGVNDKNISDRLKGMQIFAMRSDFPEIEEDGEFYISDLIDMDIKDPDSKEKIGKIIAVHNYGAGDICEVEIRSNKLLLPFNNDTFPEVDVENKVIYCNIPDEV